MLNKYPRQGSASILILLTDGDPTTGDTTPTLISSRLYSDHKNLMHLNLLRSRNLLSLNTQKKKRRNYLMMFHSNTLEIPVTRFESHLCVLLSYRGNKS